MRFIYRARLPDPRDFPQPVHDGDTLWLQLDMGRRNKADIDCRLDNVHAPELAKDAGGVDAMRYVVKWVAARNIGNWPFFVELLRITKAQDDEVMTYDRYVAIVTDYHPLEGKPGSSLNADVEAYCRAQGYPMGRGA